MNAAAALLLAVMSQSPPGPSEEARKGVPLVQRAAGVALAAGGVLALSAVGLVSAAMATTLFVTPSADLPTGVNSAGALVALPLLVGGTVAAVCLLGGGLLVGTWLVGPPSLAPTALWVRDSSVEKQAPGAEDASAVEDGASAVEDASSFEDASLVDDALDMVPDSDDFQDAEMAQGDAAGTR